MATRQSRPSSPTQNPPPGTWKPARSAVKKIMLPVERFLAIESASGILLMFMALVAMFWANSSWSDSYHALWRTPVVISIGNLSFARDIHFWINDGLMTVFFFVVGLEIRREIHRGELSSLKRATLPLAAALGGMLVPALFYLALNGGKPSAMGWGVPMATDIAFAVGVLTLLGNRVPPALRVLLLGLAVIDDIGAIIVIALFYSGTLSLHGLAVAVAGIALLILMQKVGIRSPWAYVVPALIAWSGTYAAGIHPTIAGVVVGLMTPVRAWYDAEVFLELVQERLAGIRDNIMGPEDALLPDLAEINAARSEVISPVEKIQHALHGWVSFGIMPLFALANAGVPLGNATIEGDGLLVFLGITLGLLAGKPLGVMFLSWISCRMGLTTLPAGVKWSHIALMGMCAGIGFTMAIFIGQLAFPPGPLLETAKLAILCASVLAGVIAMAMGFIGAKHGADQPT